MLPRRKSCPVPSETARVRKGFDKQAPKYGRSIARFERIVDPIAHRLGGDHMLREPLGHLNAEGFEVEEVERRKADFVELVAARKPARQPAPVAP